MLAGPPAGGLADPTAIGPSDADRNVRHLAPRSGTCGWSHRFTLAAILKSPRPSATAATTIRVPGTSRSSATAKRFRSGRNGTRSKVVDRRGLLAVKPAGNGGQRELEGLDGQHGGSSYRCGASS